ncbi:SUMF1/EgtB/PvdO family nonheme iron enzyme [Thiothrix sp.]|jgi:formylglycine-generating enzyme required for sulfatase activity|uniref:SUMF1/EgtB/PvdO family nonheme iron enzyme n=1 Tax=Thiothrix sp. TaxID=1032 RepID=UPI00257DC813|nr:SUMF1/EgtB/PvdO family nonheme iron enzyme [Thiothrix sp.]
MHDIFLSYSTKDRDRLKPLFQALAQQGWSVFWDHQSIHTGENWHRRIEEAINNSRCVVVWSKHSIQSEWVLEEASRGKSRNVLLPIRIDAIEPPFGFGMRQAGDFTGWNGKGDHPAFIELAAQIYGLLGRGSQPLPPLPKSRMGVVLAAGMAAVAVAGTGMYWHQNGGFIGEDAAAITQPVAPVAEPKVMPAPVVTPPAPAPAVAPPATPPKQPEPKTLPFEPEMLTITAGEFTMGCDGKRDDVEGGCWDDEKPAHKVKISGFKLAKTEVTFDQWDACEKAKACPHAEDLGWGRGNRPVINVSWDDVTQKYLQWLNKETGKTYRLPTEAEWEYAARGGRNDTAYSWGNAVGKGNANCDGCGSQWDDKKTAPVKSFSPNGYGLYDMHGNVWEWVSDWKGDYAAKPQQDPEGSSSGTSRVLRGGSWSNEQWNMRSARRYSYPPDESIYYVGFRPAQGQ